jgi:hypothetical protein
LKKENSDNNKHFKLDRKWLVTVSVGIMISVGIAVYIGGLVKAQSNMNMSPMVLHIHPHLNVTVDGKHLTVPALIGIETSLWKDHSLDKYEGMAGMAPLHTHDASGIIHVESSVKRNYTLGEFLNIWGGLDLNGKTVKSTVDGKPISDFRNHVLKDREQINLVIKSK